MLFAKIVLYQLSYKIMDPPKIPHPINSQTRSSLSKPQANIIKNLVFGSPDFKSLVEFQKEYQVEGLDDLISCFIAENVQDYDVEKLNAQLGMDQDFNEVELESVENAMDIFKYIIN